MQEIVRGGAPHGSANGGGRCRAGVLGTAVALAVLQMSVARAQTGTAPEAPRVVPLEQSSFAPNRLPDLGEPGAPGMVRKDYALPALEIIGFDTVLNRLNHRFIKGTNDYDVSVGSWRRNLKSSWVIDEDPFKINQFLHQGDWQTNDL